MVAVVSGTAEVAVVAAAAPEVGVRVDDGVCEATALDGAAVEVEAALELTKRGYQQSDFE